MFETLATCRAEIMTWLQGQSQVAVCSLGSKLVVVHVKCLSSAADDMQMKDASENLLHASRLTNGFVVTVDVYRYDGLINLPVSGNDHKSFYGNTIMLYTN
jgi:hypothetical protein